MCVCVYVPAACTVLSTYHDCSVVLFWFDPPLVRCRRKRMRNRKEDDSPSTQKTASVQVTTAGFARGAPEMFLAHKGPD